MAAMQSPILDTLKALWRALRGSRQDGSQELELVFRAKYVNFQELLESNAEMLRVIGVIERKLSGREVFGMATLHSVASQAVFHGLRMVTAFESLSGAKAPALRNRLRDIQDRLRELLAAPTAAAGERILALSRVGREMADVVGGKSANLGELKSRLGLPVPEGFAVTTTAFREFVGREDLAAEIAKRTLGLTPEDPASIQRASEEIQRLILLAPLPEGFAEELLAAHAALAGRLGRDPGEITVSVRSSAVGEDGELSFAGQYLSVLGVPRARLVESYKYVAASLYTPRAISYRLLKGVPDAASSMGVAVLAMVRAVSSGVMYTRHPFDPAVDGILVNAVWGLGLYAVDGVVTPDTYEVDRAGERIVRAEVASQTARMDAAEGGGLTRREMAADQAARPCLTPEQVLGLARWGRLLEEHYGQPQDVEWALDEAGDLVLLQSRPLAPVGGSAGKSGDAAPPVPGFEVLLEGGATACPGSGSGPAVLVRSEDDLAVFPEGGVLVADHSSPTFMVVMNRARAILTDHGSVTGHMASLAREFGVPALLDLGRATRCIPAGTVVTVDATRGRVYRGRVDSLLQARSPEAAPLRGTPVHGLLKAVAGLITPLNLHDPGSPEFSPEGCRTLHDITRYLHEQSYAAMFKLGDLASGRGGLSVCLDAGVGLDLHVIDLGGGLTEAVRGQACVRLDMVASRPLKALMRGLADEAFKEAGLKPVQLRGFLSVMGRQMVDGPNVGAERFGDKSYAIVSDTYLNFSSRVGYHYGVLDCYLGPVVNNNYITFSFMGGAAGDERRARRARAIAMILKALGFTVKVTGDRTEGRYQKYAAEMIEDRLVQMGRLLQYTRQTDMLMVSEESVAAMAESFLRGDRVFDLGAG